MIIPAEEMIDELQPSTIELCKEQREPAFPYVILEKPKHYVAMDGKRSKNAELKYQLRILRLDGRPDQQRKIQQNLENDGEKLVAWGNFPQLNDGNARNQQLIALHKDNYGVTPWDKIDAYLKNFVKRNNGGMVQNKKLEDEVERLRAELEEAKIAKLKQQQGQK